MKQRFLMVTTFYPPYGFGGDALYVSRLSQELVARGHHVEVVHCADSFRMLSRRASPLPAPPLNGVRVHTLRNRWGPLGPLAIQQTGRPWLSSPELGRILAEPFDTIHFHNISLIGGPGILRMGKGLKLYTLHEHWLLCPTHVLFKFNQAPCREKQCFQCQLRARRPPQWWRWSGFLKSCLKEVDGFLSPSRFTLERHAQEFDLPLHHLPSFALPSQVSPSSAPLRPYFLFVGRLEKIKGLHTILEAFRRNPEFDLKVAGEGNYGDFLRNLARDCPNIHFLGWVKGNELDRLYASALALVVPSIALETLGQVILESFAAATPVIARRLGPLPELVEESEAGFLFEDDASLEACLRRLAGDGPLRLALKEKALKAWQERWNPDIHVQRYLDLNEQLTASKPG
ncbi:glycosyltransferase family 4 protein [bacterium]|nr:glycosyltransferase family 4 protein [bacterium]